MSGYLIPASGDWCKNIRLFSDSKAVFWRKRKSFKAVDCGEYIYFMRHKDGDCSRCIVGRGRLLKSIVMSPSLAWEKYKKRLGSNSKKEFLDFINRIYKSNDLEIGCIELDDIQFLDNPVSIMTCNIEYKNGTVSGKILTDAECERVNQFFRKV